MSLLEAGLKEGKPTQAVDEARKWLNQNVPQDPMLLYHAGRAAELSADWTGAISLYRQYLLRADLTTQSANEAAFAVYTLYLERLKDHVSAYAFSRTEGDRLVACPRARQFDQWYLSYARGRRHAQGVANRLLACVQADLPTELLTTYYEESFLWLLDFVSTHTRSNHPQMMLTPQIATTCKQIAAAMTFNDDIKLRLDWAVSIKPYNLAKMDGKEATPPIAEATALLAKFPRYAKWVQDGWAAGGQHGEDAVALYWPHEVDAKIAPILDAVTKLTPLQLADLTRSWRPGHYRNLDVGTVQSVREFVKSNPTLMNSRNGMLPLDRHWDQVTAEQAQGLSPYLEHNSHPYASLVRVLAATGPDRDIDKAFDALLGPEVWRFPARFDMHRMGGYILLKLCGASKEKGDEIIKRVTAVHQSIMATEVKQDTPVAQRIAEFKRLWADYRSPQPKLPAVYERLQRIPSFTPELIPELLSDPSPEAQLLAREAVGKRLWPAKMDRFDPYLKHHWRTYPGNQRNMAGLKEREPEKFKPHHLEPALRTAIEDGIKQGHIDAWKVIAWTNMQCPEDNDEQIKLMQNLVASPVWASLTTEARFAARQWFTKDAMQPDERVWVDAADPTVIFDQMLALSDDTDTATTLAALKKAVDGVKNSPTRIHLQGLDQLAAVSDDVFTNPEVLDLVYEIADQLREPTVGYPFGKRVRDLMKQEPDPLLLHRTAYVLWQSSFGEYRKRDHQFRDVRKLAESQLEVAPSSAAALAHIGLHVYARTGGDRAYNPAEDLPPLKAMIGQAAIKMGLIRIPVGREHPAYPIYKSQGDWMTGNQESAWTLVEESWDELLPIHRELTLEYLLWVLQRTIYSRNDTRMEQLVKSLMGWSDEPGSPWSLEQKIDLELAYGDIAIQLGQLHNAHKIFVRTQQNDAYAESPARHKATLRRVRVERIAKRYDDALRTLQELDLEGIPGMWAPSRYARAEVYYDMQEYDDASDDIEAILARIPGHPDATILQGKLQLDRQKLMEASELDLGSPDAQRNLVPGEKLKVTLDDPTLAVSGMGTKIEVVVWATSGDRERFYLRQFGDQKTKFRGEVATSLGAPAPDDHTLQVLGDDQIFYAYSDRFRKQMNNMDAKRGGPITVRSDATLMASARKLLSEAEQRLADQEAMNQKLAKDGLKNLRLKPHALAELKAQITAAEESRLAKARVKPGRNINVRVIDPDRGRTAEIDEVTVSVTTSSGDSISEVSLKETGPFSGRFEGSVPTAGASAMAFAANTEPGRNPNTVISPSTDTLAWKPIKGEVPDFIIDLNDNAAIGTMTLTAREPGEKLTQFFLDTGMNHAEMETVAGYPMNPIAVEKPWHPSVRIMNDTDHHQGRDERSVYDLNELRSHFKDGWRTQRFMLGIAENVAGPSAAMSRDVAEQIEWRHHGHHFPSHVVYRFRGYFYESESVTRRFRLELGEHTIPEMRDREKYLHPAQFLLAIDGRPITDPEQPDTLEGQARLRPGLHRFEIWATGWHTSIGFGRDVKLLANVNDPDKLTDCPGTFFDPTNFPTGTTYPRNGRATVTPNADGTAFKITFPDGSRTRLMKLRFRRFEGPVPSLNKIALTDADGKQLLPIAQDYATFSRNKTLEILTGDKVTVRYLDDRFVTKDKDKHERFLDVAFSDARIGFETYFTEWGRFGPVDRYDREFRFVDGQSFPLTIRDGDMDTSDGVDTLNVTLESKSGGEHTFIAKESETYPGTFVLSVTAVSASPGKSEPGHAQMLVGPGETLTAIYRDTENLRPGVPTNRYARIGRAVYREPRLYISHATVDRLDYAQFEPEEAPKPVRLPTSYGGDLQVADAVGLNNTATQTDRTTGTGMVLPQWQINQHPTDITNPPQGGIAAVHGQMLKFEIEVPHLALRSSSSIDVYAQTDAGRDQNDLLGGLGLDSESTSPAFDINARGTIKLKANLRGGPIWRGVSRVPIYVPGESGTKVAHPPNSTFRASVPLIPGVLPEYGVLTESEIERMEQLGTYQPPRGLVVQPGELVHIGFRYVDDTGKRQWLTGSAKVTAHPVLDVMDAGYQDEKTTAFVGESLFLRVVDLGADVSDSSDSVKVLMQSKSGAKHLVNLLEVDTHSGVFLGRHPLSYAKVNPAEGTAHDVQRDGFPVIYGDVIGVRYTDRQGRKTDAKYLTISKGADGGIGLFSRRFEDPEIAMDTQFTLAEAYLEMAKRHRKLGETKKAADEYARAKSMLEKAMDMFRNPETRAHAEFLLGTLTQEEADATEDEQLKEDRYRTALSRYLRITGNYPDSEYAAHAQFMIASVYDALKEPEIAAQEYVKLAYKYPDSEHLAAAMVRLGGHFLRKATAYAAKAKPLLAKTDDEEAQIEGAVMRTMSIKEYIKSARIFARMQERFPDHTLAGKAALQAGKVFMRAGESHKAIETFKRVIDDESYDGPTLRAEAMYWTGKCYETIFNAAERGSPDDTLAAFASYKRLTYDFPESKWAAYARGQLERERFITIEDRLDTGL